MDPQVTWLAIAEAYAAGDWEKIDELAFDLASWLDKGGFPPSVTGHRDFDRLVVRNALDALLSWEIDV